MATMAIGETPVESGREAHNLETWHPQIFFLARTRSAKLILFQGTFSMLVKMAKVCIEYGKELNDGTMVTVGGDRLMDQMVYTLSATAPLSTTRVVRLPSISVGESDASPLTVQVAQPSEY